MKKDSKNISAYNNEKIFYYGIEMFSFFKSDKKLSNVDKVYSIVVDQSRKPIFYTELLIPDNIDGRFDVLSLHMFFIFSRLKNEENIAADFSQSLFDTMFVDMDQSLREMGVGDLSVGKRVKDMGKALLGRIEAYDKAFSAEYSDIEATIIRNIYRGDGPHLHQIKRLINYSKGTIENLALIPNEEILHANFSFTQTI